MRIQERRKLPTEAEACLRHLSLTEQPHLPLGSGTDGEWEDPQQSTDGKVQKCSLWPNATIGAITLTSVVHACDKTHSTPSPPALDDNYCYPLP